MSIEFSCPSCHCHLYVAPEHAGHRVRCGSCLSTVVAPEHASQPLRVRNESTQQLIHLEEEPVQRTFYRARAKRTVLFWIVLTLMLLFLIGLATCGGLVWMVQPHWQVYRSQAGGFQVDLPASPRTDIHTLTQMKMSPEYQIEGTILMIRGEWFVVMYRDYKPRVQLPQTDPLLLDEMEREFVQSDPEIQVRFTGSRTVSGFTARELITTNSRNHSASWMLFIIAKERIYLVLAGCERVRVEDNPRIRRFINSFQITVSTTK